MKKLMRKKSALQICLRQKSICKKFSPIPLSMISGGIGGWKNLEDEILFFATS
jgi:hypothetical protein